MASTVLPSADDLAELSRLHGEARYLDAYRLSQNFVPLEEWPGTEGLILAGRLASCWGDWPRSNRVHFKAWRAAPHDPGTIYYHALTLENRHGPFEALRFLHEQRGTLETATPSKHHIWLWLYQARLLALFRDFEAADTFLERAQPHRGDDAWWWVERARIFEIQDRYEEALAAAEEAMRLRPRYRQSIETKAHLLLLVNRDAEAIDLLRGALGYLQAANIAQMLAVYLSELELHAEALAAIERATEWLPCADRSQRAWLAARRSDALRFLGRTDEAAKAAREVKSPFHDHVAARIETPPADRRRVHLTVGFVRQHHMTCAPATLTALSRFWEKPVDHLELAKLICYDGTPDHEERHWAETHGWIVREFRVTWEFALALLDRGCPFTLTTVAPRSAHLQAVVGYDAALGLLLIRDPYQRTHGECIGEAFLTGCASHGPRGMVLVPTDRAELLAGLEFPDGELYDQWYALRRALERHDRRAAQAAGDRLSALASGHRLALLAQRELASYDGNLLRQLEATRALLALHPEESNFLLDEVQLLRALGRTAEMRERIRALVRRPAPDPLFLREYAEMLATDARTHRRSHQLFRRVLRRRSIDANNLRAFANLLWTQQHFVPATEIYRLAACVGDKAELHWDSFFSASRHTRAADACLALLRQREARLGAQSGQPIRTLFRAYEALDQTPVGFVALEAALARRPDDGELLLFAVECHGRFGRSEEAARLLAAAKERSPQSSWVRTAAHFAEIRTDHAAALGHWREILAMNPVDVGAHRAVARLVAMLEGREQALDFLRGSCEAHPSVIPLLSLWLEWLRGEEPAKILPTVDRLLALDPGNAWALREKSLLLGRQQKGEEALALADTACGIEPHSVLSRGVRGLALAALGRTAEARAEYESALRLSLDTYYMAELIHISADFAARGEAVAFLQAELIRQPVPEDAAFLRFRDIARNVLTPDETRAALEAILAAHPNHWAIWSALTLHLIDQGQTDAALARAKEAAERFPLSPRTWLDLANAQSHARQSPAEIESLRRALELSPAWGHASRALAAAHERALQLDAAEHVLRRAVGADPLDAIGHGHLADLLWRTGKKTEALALIERTLQLESGYDWAWDALDEWAKTTPDKSRATQLAEQMTQSRPGDAATWQRLARLQFHTPAVALATLDRALALNPRDVDLHDLRAHLLSAAGREDDAVAACRPAIFGDSPPRGLRGRAAWIEHHRGRTAAAIVQMRLVVKDHPDYAWGWSCLTEWYWTGNEFASALETASKWAWLAPLSATPLGYMAGAHKRLGKRREAKDAFWRALHRDPNYRYGAQALLELLVEDRELEEATRLLRHIETHLSPGDAQRAAVLYHIMRRDQVAAGAALAQLARLNSAPAHLLHECAKALGETGWRSTIEKALEPLLAEPTANPEIARVWVNAWAPDGAWGKLRKLDRSAATEAVKRTAWAAALEQLGRKRATWRLRWYRARRGEWLRAHAQTWGSMGYALVTSGRRRAAISWLKNWAEIKGCEPWMLYNLTWAYYQVKQPALAWPVVQAALALPNDNTRVDFLLWRGLECALRGDTAGAQEALAQTAAGTLDAEPKLLRAFTQLLVDFDSARVTSPANALRVAKAKLASLWAENNFAKANNGLLHFRARILRRLARDAGSWFTHVQSRLPAPGRQYVSSRPKGSGDNVSWWAIWIGFMVLSSLARSCSGHY